MTNRESGELQEQWRTLGDMAQLLVSCAAGGACGMLPAMHHRRFLLPLLLAAGILFAPFRGAAQSVTASDEVDEAIERGLRYLASVQRENGSFPRRYGETGAISALAGMAFLAKGYTPGCEKYGENINRSIDYILSCVNPTNGYFGVKLPNQGMYVHAICTLFLTEVSGMVDPVRQARIDEVVPNAVKLILDAQNIGKDSRDRGGWRYTPTSRDSDMSCSGWVLMALRSARLNGGKVPGDAIERAVAYVKRQYNEAEGSFHYQGTSGQYALTLTGAGILCLELCGRHEDPDSLAAARYLMGIYKSAGNEGMMQQEYKYYGMYYASQGLFQLGGENWKEFSTWMYDTFLPLQGADGSWRGRGGEDSRAYATSMIILAFAVPYRQLPVYQRDETVDE